MSNVIPGRHRFVVTLSEVSSKCLRLSTREVLPAQERRRFLVRGKRLRVISKAFRNGTHEFVNTLSLKNINKQLKLDLDRIESAEAIAVIRDITCRLDLLLGSVGSR